MLEIVCDEYEGVANRHAFRFLDALIGSDLHFETASSLWGGRRVWCLARLPESVEFGGDQSATYVRAAVRGRNNRLERITSITLALTAPR